MIRRCGFTLIEVLVAIAVLSVALLAASRTSGLVANTADQLSLRLAADWVASDRLAEYQALRTWPALGDRSGDVVQAGRALVWLERVTATPNLRFRKVEVMVFEQRGDERPVSRLVGFAVNRPR